ncbi:acyl-CoA synthetase [Myxococcota bacterium]|nr:acyl-CoA synthetase [Myxococcota bacterium]
MNWNFGDILDGIESGISKDAPAIIHGDRTVTWGEFSSRTNNLARALQNRGLNPGDKVGFYVRNSNAYPECLAACFKARLVHVNVNFRYRDKELWYILDNSDAKAVVYDAEFSNEVEALKDRLPGVVAWIKVGGQSLKFSDDYENLVTDGLGKALEVERSGEDLLFVYTGGTTGMPKGVMWRAEDLWFALGGGINTPANRGEAPESIEAHVNNVLRAGPGGRQIPCCPLMHGTGLFTAVTTLLGAGCVITLQSPGFDASEAFSAVEKHQADSLVIVGDAFARPMLNALESEPNKWDISSIKVIVSSGVMWSRDIKQALLKFNDKMMLVDLFGSSEAIGFGTSITTAKGETRTAKFQIGDKCKVFTEDHKEVAPGSDERGFIARCGPIPVGYYKDEEKSAKTFPTIKGVRYSIPGDWCTVAEDGTLTLLGRGSNCINSAGEKIYPEEVEEVLKTTDSVEDALVVGVPDEKWGSAVVAVVELSSGYELDEQTIRESVRGQLAGYKVPKRIFAVAKMFRAPNGKADYKSATSHAEASYSST